MARIESDRKMLEKNQNELESQLKNTTSESDSEEVKKRFRENMDIYEKSISVATAELESIETDLMIATEDPTNVDDTMA